MQVSIEFIKDYGHYKVGDILSIPDGQAKVLRLLGYAIHKEPQRAVEAVSVAEQPVAANEAPERDIEALRAEYLAITGERVHHKLGAEKIALKIEELKAGN